MNNNKAKALNTQQIRPCYICYHRVDNCVAQTMPHINRFKRIYGENKENNNCLQYLEKSLNLIAFHLLLTFLISFVQEKVLGKTRSGGRGLQE